MHLFNFETKDEPLLGRAAFVQRLALNLLVGLALIAVSLFAGMAGYMATAGLGAVDAFLNASMILSGMGPVADLPERSAKIFAGFYALYSGLALVALSGLVLAPVFHRVLHGLHVDDDDEDRKPNA